MRYLLNNTFNFDDLDGSLINVKTEIKVNIPVTAVIILSYILKHQGETLQRETIFADIWEKYGQTPSNNTLTQYISLIRKSFQQIGFTDELIVTIPKVGFYISSEIHIIYESCQQIENKKTRRFYPVRGILKFIGFTVVSIFFTAIGYYGGINNANERMISYIDNNEQCRLHTLMGLLSENYQPGDEDISLDKKSHLPLKP